MEINYAPKGLHKHALPVGLVLLALLIGSALITNAYPITQTSNTSLTHGLVTQVIHIRPTSNGLAKITTANEAPLTNSSFTDAGRAAQFMLSFPTQPERLP